MPLSKNSLASPVGLNTSGDFMVGDGAMPEVTCSSLG
jgi:hypothetical protein